MPEPYQQDLEQYRVKIDEIDKNIVDLLNERTKVAQHIRDIKIEHKLPFYQPDREKLIFDKLTEYNQGPFPTDKLPTIFKEIIVSSREAQGDISVAYLGPKGSYTHQACYKEFGHSIQERSMSTIPDIFKVVENDQVHYGVVPIENSYEGMVNRTLDCLAESNLNIKAELYLPISHCLVSQLDDVNKIKKIYSHPQAFAQCRIWLDNFLPNVEKIHESSTSKAAELVEWDKYSAAIASEMAAELYGLNVLARDIQTSVENTTRFIVIGNSNYHTTTHNDEKYTSFSHIDSVPTGDDKTSLIISIKDEPGALMRILSPFEILGLNLTKIESRPSRKKAWDYLFFIDVETHSSAETFQKVIEKIKSVSFDVNVMGSYPKRTA